MTVAAVVAAPDTDGHGVGSSRGSSARPAASSWRRFDSVSFGGEERVDVGFGDDGDLAGFDGVDAREGVFVFVAGGGAVVDLGDLTVEDEEDGVAVVEGLRLEVRGLRRGRRRRG